MNLKFCQNLKFEQSITNNIFLRFFLKLKFEICNYSIFFTNLNKKLKATKFVSNFIKLQIF